MSQLATTMNTGLALLLGVTGTLALTGSQAVGYPTGAVSVGVTPVVSQGGAFSDDGTAVLFSADEGFDVVVTDVVLTMGRTTWTSCRSTVTLSLSSDGHYVGRFVLQADGNADRWDGSGTNQAQVSHSFTSGILVPSGDSLLLTASTCEPVNYTLSGYYAQP